MERARTAADADSRSQHKQSQCKLCSAFSGKLNRYDMATNAARRENSKVTVNRDVFVGRIVLSFAFV